MDDLVLSLILQYTDSGADYKNFCLVNKRWYSIINEWFPKGGEFVNHLMTIYNKFPTREWNYSLLFNNPGFRLDKITDPRRRDWVASKWRPPVQPEVRVHRWRERPIYYGDLDRILYSITNPIVTIEQFNVILQDVPKRNRATAFHNFSRYHNHFTTEHDKMREFVEQNITEPWDFVELANLGVITWEYFVENYKIIENTQRFGPGKKVEAVNAPWDIVISNPQIAWDYNRLCNTIPCHIILSFPSLFNNVSAISANPTLTWDMVVNRPYIHWNFAGISSNTFGRTLPN